MNSGGTAEIKKKQQEWKVAKAVNQEGLHTYNPAARRLMIEGDTSSAAK